MFNDSAFSEKLKEVNIMKKTQRGFVVTSMVILYALGAIAFTGTIVDTVHNSQKPVVEQVR